MNKALIIGAGGVGQSSAGSLVARGWDVVLASRSGATPSLPEVRGIQLDATDPDAVTKAAEGMDVLINAVNPKNYARWDRDWPPIASAILTAAGRHRLNLVTVSNLYGYGKVSAPMTEETPMNPNGSKGAVRAQMWYDALAAHEAGQIKATEVRPSDYFGPGANPLVSMVNTFIIKRAAAGKTVWMPFGRPDAPHSWSYLEDIAELVAVVATDDRSWGRPWHVPTAPPRTATELANDVADIVGGPKVRVREMPAMVKKAMRVSEMIRSLDETKHQHEEPWILDATAAEQTFGLTPTDWHKALSATISLAEVVRPR